MTANDELRHMLDERGVEWGSGFGGDTLWTGRHGIEWRWDKQKGALAMYSHTITLEQAIEATLGNEESYTRDDVESAFVSGYSLGSLPVGSGHQWDENRQIVDEHMAELGWVRAETLWRGKVVPLWKDGAFFCDCGAKLGEDALYCGRCGRKILWGVLDGPNRPRTKAATVGVGTCKVESSIQIEFDTLISPDYFEFEMSCGSRFRWSDNEPPDYCPGCGRKVVDGRDGS